MFALLGLTREEIKDIVPQEQEIIFLYTGPPIDSSRAAIPRAICLRLRKDKLECILAFTSVNSAKTAPSG